MRSTTQATVGIAAVSMAALLGMSVNAASAARCQHGDRRHLPPGYRDMIKTVLAADLGFAYEQSYCGLPTGGAGCRPRSERFY